VGESELPAQSCLWGWQRTLGMMARPWERALLARMQGMAVAFFFIWLSAALRMRGSRESSTTWHGYATACQESIQPKAMWAPALVPPPLIGRHRSRCSWDVPVTPFKRCLVQRMQRICERRSTLLKGTGGKLPCLAASTQLPINYISTPMREDLMIIVRVEASA
jgi:hypothetical protein